MARIACAFIARFELAIRAREVSALWQRPLAIADVARLRSPLLALTSAAEAMHLREGMALNEALSIFPSLEIVAPSPELVRAAETEILSTLGAISPALDSDGFGAFYLTLAGLDRLVEDEGDFARQIRAHLRKVGYQASVGIADGPLAARIAAGRAADIAIVPAGADAEAIAGVPIGSFGLPHAVLSWLELLGLREAGQLARLPPGTLSMRLPVEGPRLERLCRGETPIAWPSASRLPAKSEEVALDLDVPTSELELLLFLFKSLIDQLLAKIHGTRRGLATLHVEVRLDDRSRVRHTLVTASPTLDGRTWMDLARLWLSSAPFASDVAGVRLVAARTDVTEARQIALFSQREERARHALRTAVRRLAAAFGESAVVQPVLVDTYLPEARLRWSPFTEERLDDASEKGPEEMMLPALRLCVPAQPVGWDGHQLRHATGLSVRMVHVEGPYRLSGETTEGMFDRTYLELAGARGDRLWVFHDELREGFFLLATAE